MRGNICITRCLIVVCAIVIYEKAEQMKCVEMHEIENDLGRMMIIFSQFWNGVM